MKKETLKSYGRGIMYGAMAGILLGQAYAFNDNITCDCGNENFLQNTMVLALLTVGGAVGGIGIAALYNAGKRIYSFCNKKTSSEKGGNLEKLIEK